MKRLLIIGVGAQGSTVAKQMDEEPGVSEIICADHDEKAVNEMERTLEKAGLTAETYLTGQCGALFTKMFVNDRIHQKAMFPPEVLETDQRAYYFKEAAKLDITVDQIVAKKLY